jgi:hypothetical protein
MTAASQRKQRAIRFSDAIEDDNGKPEYLDSELTEALSSENARKFDGDPNFEKCIDIKVAVVGDERGDPVFSFETKSPRSVVNNLGCSIRWTTNSKTRALAFLREMAERIEKL